MMKFAISLCMLYSTIGYSFAENYTPRITQTSSLQLNTESTMSYQILTNSHPTSTNSYPTSTNSYPTSTNSYPTSTSGPTTSTAAFADRIKSVETGLVYSSTVRQVIVNCDMTSCSKLTKSVTKEAGIKVVNPACYFDSYLRIYRSCSKLCSNTKEISFKCLDLCPEYEARCVNPSTQIPTPTQTGNDRFPNIQDCQATQEMCRTYFDYATSAVNNSCYIETGSDPPIVRACATICLHENNEGKQLKCSHVCPGYKSLCMPEAITSQTQGINALDALPCNATLNECKSEIGRQVQLWDTVCYIDRESGANEIKICSSICLLKDGTRDACQRHCPGYSSRCEAAVSTPKVTGTKGKKAVHWPTVWQTIVAIGLLVAVISTIVCRTNGWRRNRKRAGQALIV